MQRHSSYGFEKSLSGATGGSQVKTLTIRLPDVEASMLVEVQKRSEDFRSL